MAFPKWLNLYVCIFLILVSLLIAYLSRYGPRNIQRDESPLDDPEASLRSQMDFWLLFHTTEIFFTLWNKNLKFVYMCLWAILKQSKPQGFNYLILGWNLILLIISHWDEIGVRKLPVSLIVFLVPEWRWELVWTGLVI